MTKTLVCTTYNHPDLDGVACMVAYSELLRMKGKDAKAIYFKEPTKEARYLLGKLGDINLLPFEALEDKEVSYIILDASNPQDLSEQIDSNDVVEVIDHRETNNVQGFKNATSQIELVGSCATLITEKYMNENKKPSKESALLLYGAIISNTINFKATLTTQRDKDAAEFLKEIVCPQENFVEEMFEFKSQIDNEELDDLLICETKSFEHNSIKYTIVQVEIAAVEHFVNNHKEKLMDYLEEVKRKEQSIFSFLSCVDILKGYNIFITQDKKAQELLENIFSIQFINNQVTRESIIMRKQIVPLINQGLEK